MSWGAFANGIADGYMVSAKNRREREAADREQEEFARKKADWKKQDDIQRTVADAPLQEGTGFGDKQATALGDQANSGDAAFDQAVRQSAIDVGRENVRRAQQTGALPAGMPVKTRDQVKADTVERVRALDYKAADQMEATDLQLKGARQAVKKGEFELGTLERNAKFDQKFDTVMESIHQDAAKRLQSIETVAQTGGMKGLVETFGPELKKALGADVQLVGNNIVVREKGQKPRTISSLSQAVEALQGAAQLEFGDLLEKRIVREGLFKTPQEMTAYFAARREEARKGRDTDSQISLRGAQANQANAAAGYYNRGGASANRQSATEAVRDKAEAYAAALIGAGEINPKTKEPYTKEEALRYGYAVAMRDPNAKQTSGIDVKGDYIIKDGEAYTLGPDGKAVRVQGLGPSALDRAIEADLKNKDRGKTPAPAPAATPAAPQRAIPTGPAQHSNISPELQNQLVGQLRSVEEALAQAEAQASAVSRSGDTAAIVRYGNIVNDLRRQRDELANSPLISAR